MLAKDTEIVSMRAGMPAVPASPFKAGVQQYLCSLVFDTKITSFFAKWQAARVVVAD